MAHHRAASSPTDQRLPADSSMLQLQPPPQFTPPHTYYNPLPPNPVHTVTYDGSYGGYSHPETGYYGPRVHQPPMNFPPPSYEESMGQIPAPGGSHQHPRNRLPAPPQTSPPLRRRNQERDGRRSWLQREIVKITVKIKNLRNSCAQEKRRKIQNAKAASGETMDQIIDNTFASYQAVKVSREAEEVLPPIQEEISDPVEQVLPPLEEEISDLVGQKLMILKLNYDLEGEKEKGRRQEDYISKLEGLLVQLKSEKDEEKGRLMQEVQEITQDLESKRDRDIAPLKREKARLTEGRGLALSAEESDLSPMDE